MTTTGLRRLWLPTGLALSLAACASPTTPSVSVAAARPLGPDPDASISYYSQPIVLRLANGVTTGRDSPATMVEVATDASFAHVVTTQAATMGADGQLTVTLAPLAGSTTYYWHARTATGNQPGAVSPVASFSIGPAVAIEAPVAVQPLANTYPHKRPTFVVMNATHSGPPASLTYSFEVATDSTFGSLVASGSVPEGSTQTSFMPTTDLRSGTTYYWRVHASDATHSVNGPFSVVQSFTTANPDDGVSRYTLTLHLVSAEDCSAWGPPSLRDVSFDDGLVVTGDHLRYRVEENFTTAVALNLVRDADVISGTLEGNLDWPGHRFLGVLFKLNVVAGTRDDESGRFTGTAVGPLAEAGIPGYNACGRATVAFTLTPH